MSDELKEKGVVHISSRAVHQDIPQKKSVLSFMDCDGRINSRILFLSHYVHISMCDFHLSGYLNQKLIQLVLWVVMLTGSLGITTQ